MMVKLFHTAAQYLATAAISFLETKPDDSHTNLGWKNGALHTHPLNSTNTILSFDYNDFALIFTNDSGDQKSLSLDLKTHAEIKYWLKETALLFGLKKGYEYKLHYDLPYEKITDRFVFHKPANTVVELLIRQRDLAQKAIERILKNNDLETPIRIWPHHFDTGSFFMLNEAIGIGIGMAIPDTMINDFYLYLSGYKGHVPIQLPSSITMSQGNYHSNGWKGFAYAVSDITIDKAIAFYTEALENYKMNI